VYVQSSTSSEPRFYAHTHEAVISLATERKFEQLVSKIEEVREFQTDERSDLRKATAKYDQWLGHHASLQVRVRFRITAFTKLIFLQEGASQWYQFAEEELEQHSRSLQEQHHKHSHVSVIYRF
jgi:transposase